jgi:hypothetical protein
MMERLGGTAQAHAESEEGRCICMSQVQVSLKAGMRLGAGVRRGWAQVKVLTPIPMQNSRAVGPEMSGQSHWWEHGKWTSGQVGPVEAGFGEAVSVADALTE